MNPIGQPHRYIQKSKEELRDSQHIDDFLFGAQVILDEAVLRVVEDLGPAYHQDTDNDRDELGDTPALVDALAGDRDCYGPG